MCEDPEMSFWSHLNQKVSLLSYRLNRLFEGTASIKMHEIDPSHEKETSFTCSLVIN